MKDYEIVAVARRLEKLRVRWMDICDDLPQDVRDALDDNVLIPYAWPEHAIQSCLAHPERWECGEWGIRRKGRIE